MKLRVRRNQSKRRREFIKIFQVILLRMSRVQVKPLKKIKMIMDSTKIKVI